MLGRADVLLSCVCRGVVKGSTLKDVWLFASLEDGLFVSNYFYVS